MIGHQLFRALCFCLFVSLTVSIQAQTDSTLVLAATDSTQTVPVSDSTMVAPDNTAATQFRATDLILPGSLIAVGTFGMYSKWFHGIREDVRDQMNDWRGNHRIHLDDYMKFMPLTAHLALGLAGVKGRHSNRERLCLTFTSYAIMSMTAYTMKFTMREHRPDNGEPNSYPSGHCATVFLGAELVRMEYGTAYGIAAYAMATGVAFLRIYNGRHWLNDVIGGAGVGILAARIGRWLLPWERKVLGWKGDSDFAIIPSVQPHGMSLSMTMGL